MSKTLKILNEGFMRKYMKEDLQDVIEKEVKKVLTRSGYNTNVEGADNYISAAAEYIDMSREYQSEDYSVEDWLHDTELNYPEDLAFMKESCDDCIEESVLKEDTVFHNDNGIDYDVIERSSSGKNALLKDGKQWIVAWNCPEDSGSWGQGHYFFDEAEARKVWEDKYVNESLKEDYTFGLDDSVKEYIKYITPDDYQIDKIRPNLTFGDVLSNMLSKRGNLLGTYVDSALGQKVLNGLEEIIGTDKFDKVYNNWVNSPVRRNRKISRNDPLKESKNENWMTKARKMGYTYKELVKLYNDETGSTPESNTKKFVDWVNTYLSESLKEDLDESTYNEFLHELYNAIADICFKYNSFDLSQKDIEKALDWFTIHFFDLYDDEDYFEEKLQECINRLNEAEMSDEDKADSALLRSIYNKTQQRANAKLTPEEKAVLDKYNLRRDSDIKNIRKSTPENPWGNSLIDQRVGDKFRRWNQDETKINLADRARKMDDRGAGYHATQGYYYDSVSDDHREVRDPKTGRWRSLKGKGLLDQERKHQDSVMKEPVRQMKDAIHDRKYHQKNVDSNNAEYDARRAKIQAEYEKKLRDNENSRKWSGEYHQKELDRSKDRIDKLLKRDKKEDQ